MKSVYAFINKNRVACSIVLGSFIISICIFYSYNLNVIEGIWSIIGSMALIAAVWAAIWAARKAELLAQEQNKISERLLEIEKNNSMASEFVEIAVQAQPFGLTDQQIATGVIAPGRWRLIIKAIGDYPVYITDYEFQGISFTPNPTYLDHSPIPPDGRYITISTPSPLVSFRLIINFENYLGSKYRSIHECSFGNGGTHLAISSQKRVPL